MINEMQYRGGIANTTILGRFKQVIILMAIIAAGIVISVATESKSENLTTEATVLNK